MRILVYSARPDFELAHAGKAALPYFLAGAAEAALFSPQDADLAYLDRSALSPSEFERLRAHLRKRCGAAAWGVIDPDGQVGDPASLFHEGASDYLGPAALAKGLSQERFARAAEFRSAGEEPKSAATNAAAPKAREADFPGWSALEPGKEGEFYFLYVSPSDPAFLKSKIGEPRYQALKERLHQAMTQMLSDSKALSWIRADSAVLFLIPPSAVLARAAVVAAAKCLLSAPLLGYERFSLEVPLALTFALHRGTCPYMPPGRTGTVVADDVNFIHHLGRRGAESERVTITESAADAIPKELEYMFTPAGYFEEREIRHSRRFVRGAG
jgi:hypothetical protein